MTEPDTPKRTRFPTYWLSGAATIVLIWFFSSTNAPQPIKAMRAGSSTITTTEVRSLVGLTAADVRSRLGKPGSVQLRSSPLWGNQPNADECWRYMNRVTHKDSGTKLGVALYLSKGRCIKADTF